MIKKGFEAKLSSRETPNPGETADRPLISNNIQNSRVDINVLKARAKAVQDKENIKSSIVIIFFVVALGAAGIYFSI